MWRTLSETPRRLVKPPLVLMEPSKVFLMTRSHHKPPQ